MRRMAFLAVMSSAAVIPYLMSTGSEWWGSAKSYFASSPGEASGQSAAPAAFNGTVATAAHQFDRTLPALPGSVSKAPPVEGYGAADLREVINFGATPAWVMARWPRVTVGLAELNLQGYRVPLVTGTRQDDLAGSLTYYFDENQQVRLIHFRGTTGDPRKLVALVMNDFKLRPQETGDPGLQLYQTKWNGKPTNELQVRTARIIRASQPYNRYSLELALKRQ